MAVPDWILILFSLTLAVMGVPFVILLMSLLGAWPDLEKQFPAQPRSTLRRAGQAVVDFEAMERGIRQFVRLSRGNHSVHYVNFWDDATYLHLAKIRPFNLLRRRISVPWDSVTTITPSKGYFRRPLAIVSGDSIRFKISQKAVASELAAREALRTEAASAS